jgi:hypothetical protein
VIKSTEVREAVRVGVVLVGLNLILLVVVYVLLRPKRGRG